MVTGTAGRSCREAIDVAVVWADHHIDRISRLMFPQPEGQGGGVPLKMIKPQRDIAVHLPNVIHSTKTGFSVGAAVALAVVFRGLKGLGAQMRTGIAVTGEINLRGQMIPITGIVPKVQAARLAGCKKVIVPASHQDDMAALVGSMWDGEAREWAAANVVSAIDMMDVLELAIEGGSMQLLVYVV